MVVVDRYTGATLSRKTKKPVLVLDATQTGKLTALAGSRTAPARDVERAQMLLAYAAGQSLAAIARAVGVSRPTVYKCIEKAINMGPDAALRDLPRPGREPEISDASKAWVVSLAGQKPKDLGLAAELWTLSALARYVCQQAVAAGFPRLSRVGKMAVWRILDEPQLKPHRVRYDRERKDPNFAEKMAEVLLVYQQVSMQATQSTGTKPAVYSVSVDEKPGLQALGLRAPDRPPVAGQYAQLARDDEYGRYGTLSILAALDLHTGEIIANVESRHRSREFIALLKRLDAHYPPDASIRIILDHHSSHTAKETAEYLATRPGRFQYVHTPVHAAWLNLVAVAFSKMSRTFLRHIRVDSLEDLRRHIRQGIDEMNQVPVPFRWKSFGDNMANSM